MPGHYRVQVRTAVGNGMPFGNPAEVNFTIHRPWWATGWALTGYALLLLTLCSVGWMIYRRIENNRIEKRHNEEKMLLRMTELIDRCNYYEEILKVNVENAKEDLKEKIDHPEQRKSAYEPLQPEMSQEDKDYPKSCQPCPQRVAYGKHTTHKLHC